MPDGKPGAGLDLCKVMHAAGAPYVQRLIGIGDFSGHLARAFSQRGFSFIEILELCTSYGNKFNPGRKPADIARETGLDPVVLQNNRATVFSCSPNTSATLIIIRPYLLYYPVRLGW
jgi:pyruvate/2-oxoacid:ferredoxin oxidoreductase beta subunit